MLISIIKHQKIIALECSADKLEVIELAKNQDRVVSKPKQTGSFIGGLVIGSAIGTALGLLIAPRTGKETRKVIKKSADALPELAEDLGTSLQIQTDRLSSSTSENWEGTLMRLRQAIAAGIETSRSSRNTIKSNLQQQDLDSPTTDSF